MTKQAKKLTVNAKKFAPDAIIPKQDTGVAETTVKVEKAQLEELIRQNQEYKEKYNEVKADIERVAQTFQRMFDELGIREGTSKSSMFYKLSKVAKQILIDQEAPSWMDQSLLELFRKYTSLVPNEKSLSTDQTKNLPE
jgi:antitoxin component YwqK of YwqJK toxin-antitoxin module